MPVALFRRMSAVAILAALGAGALTACGTAASTGDQASQVAREGSETSSSAPLKCGKGKSLRTVITMLAPSAFDGELATDTPEKALKDKRQRLIHTKSGLTRDSEVAEFERQDLEADAVEFRGKDANGNQRSRVSVVSMGEGKSKKWLVQAESVCGRSLDPNTIGKGPRPEQTEIPVVTHSSSGSSVRVIQNPGPE